MRAILTYHSIDDSGSPISISPVAFRSHIAFLGSGKVRVVTLADIARADDGHDAVALTFDDGFQNFGEHALPLLVDHGLPATVFVVSECAGGTNAWGGGAVGDAGIPVLPLMTWDTLGRVQQSGVEIGAHSRRHRKLTEIPEPELADEVSGCADRIQDVLGTRPSSFAYPYGMCDLRTRAAVRDAYDRACTTDMRWLGAADDTALLPRIDMYYFRAPRQLETWGTPAFARRLWLRAQGRRVRQLAARMGVTP